MSRLAILCAEWVGLVSSLPELRITLSLACDLVSLLNSQSNRYNGPPSQRGISGYIWEKGWVFHLQLGFKSESKKWVKWLMNGNMINNISWSRPFHFRVQILIIILCTISPDAPRQLHSGGEICPPPGSIWQRGSVLPSYQWYRVPAVAQSSTELSPG